jgi:hypothetical protein
LIRAAAFSSLRRVSTLTHGLLVILGLAIAANAAFNPKDACARPDVPAGIAFDTPLKQGESKLSYSYQRIQRGGLRKGKHRIAANDPAVLALANQIPSAMHTDIHTLGVQHAPYERLTLALQLPLVSHRMRQNETGAGAYPTDSFGVGDLEIVGMVPFMVKGNETLDIYLGLRLPTADVGNKGDVDFAGARGLLPVAMQSGGRTTSIIAGLSYQGYFREVGWGVNGSGGLGFGDNHRGYRLGNEMAFTGWLSHEVTTWFSSSLRLAYDRSFGLQRSQVSGPPDHLASLRSSTGGERVTLGPGISVGVPGNSRQRLSIEAAWPVHQSLRGVQLDRKWSLTTGWEWIF